MNTIHLNGLWKTRDYKFRKELPDSFEISLQKDEWIDARVPGDIHDDLLCAGRIPAPYYSDNSLQCSWVTEKDWCFFKEFSIPEDFIEKNTYLVFEGIDTFAEVYLNGRKIGSCDNMFLKYQFEVSKYIKKGKNSLVVYIKSIKGMAETYPTCGYFACFNIQRIFIRKAQCHFSWDWAPEFPATGIWNNVYLTTRSGSYINDYAIRTGNDGSVSFFINLDKNTAESEDEAKMSRRELLITIRDGDSEAKYRFEAGGIKNYYTVYMENHRLWWPNGMGEPNLYPYTIELYENEELSDRIDGKFGIREIELEQMPRKNEGGFTCQIKVNGQRVFIKGANWVPLDIMTGIIEDSKYEEAIDMAVDANFSVLRVWGGGIYEKDIFYDLCDKKGIMVWQDFMFACSDVPDDFPGFVDSIVPEIEYQIARLRNHPCLVLWCGGNEKTGSYGKAKSRGDRIIYYLIRGIAGHLDPTRPYFPSSPWGYKDVGNYQDSGDSHCNSYQYSMNTARFSNFRQVLSGFTPPLASEIAVQGCPKVISLKKYIPSDMLWPINRIWDIHFTKNPYDGTGITFAEQQMKAAKELFGGFDDVYEFSKKSMTVHSEFIKADTEYHRTRKENCSGTMFWMYSDVWPCGTWAIIDYYLFPKAAYYSVKRAFSPLLVAITQKKDGTKDYIINDTLRPVSGSVVVGQRKVNGKVIRNSEIKGVKIEANSSMEVFNFNGFISDEADSYLFIHFKSETGIFRNIFFHKLWKDIKWPDPELETEILRVMEKNKKYLLSMKLKSDKFARMVNIRVAGQEKVQLSDNFFDMEAGDEKIIEIYSKKPFLMDDVIIGHWNTRWE